jgi:hypothetical protein
MATRAGVGHSVQRNASRAIEEAVAAARGQSGIDRPDFVLLFAGVGHDQKKLVRTIRELTSRAPLAGCSAEGVITSAGAMEDPFAVAVALIQSDDVRFRAVSASGLKEDSARVGREIADILQADLGRDAIALLMLPDGLTVNFDSVLRGFSERAPKGFPPLFGGTASDNWSFEKTYQYIDDEVLSDAAVAVLMSGQSHFTHAVNHGCVAIGAERKVTRAVGNVIWEIDGKPALDVMREYIDIEEEHDWQKAIVNLAIGFKAPGDFAPSYDEYMIRFVPQKDDNERWIAIPTAIETGTSIWMTRRDYDKISDGLERIAKQIRATLEGRTPSLFIHIDCTGRGRVIFRDEEKQRLASKLHAQLGPQVPWIGFYSYGEIGAVRGVNCFHNYTCVVAALG